MAPTYRSVPPSPESRWTRLAERLRDLLLKVLGVRADDDDVEPLDSGTQGATMPPPDDGVSVAAFTSRLPTTFAASNRLSNRRG